MKIKAMVVKDVTRPWEMDGRTGYTRKLTCMDQTDDASARLVAAFDVKLADPVDKVAGDGKQGASIENCFVTVSVTDIDQQERTKRLTFVGAIETILGKMEMVPFKPSSVKAS